VKKLKQIMKKINWMSVAQFVVVMVIALSPVFAGQVFAQLSGTGPAGIPPCPPNSILCRDSWTLASVFQLVLQVAIGIAFLVSVLILVYGGFMYITAAGNDERATKGRKAIISALVGLAVVLLSYVLVNLVYKFVVGL